jgi:hypothetical protein
MGRDAAKHLFFARNTSPIMNPQQGDFMSRTEEILALLVRGRTEITEAYEAERARYIESLAQSGRVYSMLDPYLANLQRDHNRVCNEFNKRIKKLEDKIAKQ